MKFFIIGLGVAVAALVTVAAILYNVLRASSARIAAVGTSSRLAKGTAARRRKSAKQRRDEQRRRGIGRTEEYYAHDRSDDDSDVDVDPLGTLSHLSHWHESGSSGATDSAPNEPSSLDHMAIGHAVGEVEKIRTEEPPRMAWSSGYESSSSESSSSYDSSSSSYSDSSSSSDSGGSSSSDT